MQASPNDATRRGTLKKRSSSAVARVTWRYFFVTPGTLATIVALLLASDAFDRDMSAPPTA